MSNARAPRPLPIVGGHLALDFANTVDDPLGPARHDHVSDYEHLVGWARRVDIVHPARAARLLAAAADRQRAAASAVTRAHDLRRSINSVFGAIADSTDDISEAWPDLRRFVARALSSAELAETSTGGFGWSWQGSEDLSGAILDPIAAAAADLLVGDAVHRIKRCARCPWLFLDASKNQRRRWCDMSDCGRAEKMERYVQRRSAKRAVERPSGSIP